MLQFFTQTHRLFGLAVGLYLVPLWIISGVNISFLSPAQSWKLLSLGLFLSSVGAFFLFFVLKGWEDALKATSEQEIDDPQIDDTVHSSLEEKILELEAQNKSLLEALQENKASAEQLAQDLEEYARSCHTSALKNEENEKYIHELHQEIADQKGVLQNKDKWILDLESQVQDRNYELQTLIKFGDLPKVKKEADKEEKVIHGGSLFRTFPPPYTSVGEDVSEETKVHNHESASTYLQHCIDIAQKITGANHLASGSSLFRDLSVNSYALDLRRLCDSLGNENTAAVAVYSKKENRLLFANHEIRNLLGWSPEKFSQDFPEIVQEGFTDWKAKIFGLIESEEGKVRLLVKTKAGENLLLNCHLGLIPNGIFRNHVIAVFYSA